MLFVIDFGSRCLFVWDYDIFGIINEFKKWKKKTMLILMKIKSIYFFSKEEKTYNMITFFLSCIYLLKKLRNFPDPF